MKKRTFAKWVNGAVAALFVLIASGYAVYVSRPVPSFEEEEQMILKGVHVGSPLETVELFLKWRRIPYRVYTGSAAAQELSYAPDGPYDDYRLIGTVPKSKDLGYVIHIQDWRDGMYVDRSIALFFDRTRRLVARYGPYTVNGLH